MKETNGAKDSDVAVNSRSALESAEGSTGLGCDMGEADSEGGEGEA